MVLAKYLMGCEDSGPPWGMLGASGSRLVLHWFSMILNDPITNITFNIFYHCDLGSSWLARKWAQDLAENESHESGTISWEVSKEQKSELSTYLYKIVQVWSMLINCVYCMNMYESSKVALISYTSIEQTGIICLWNCMKPHRRCQVSSNLAQPNICIDCSAARPFQQESLYMLQGLLWQGEHQHQAQCRQCQKCWAMISGKPSKAPKPWCHGAVAKRPSLHSHKSMSKATARLSGPWSRNKKLLHAMLMLCLWCVKFTPCAIST